MNKKIFVSLVVAVFAIFSFSICFANDGNTVLNTATNDIRNFVGGVENTVENAALDISNTSKDVTGDTENKMSKSKDKMNNGIFSSAGATNNYSARRTSTENTVMGMSSNAWTWIILGVAAIAIIAVVWYYSMQFTNNNHHNDDSEE